MLYSSIDIGTNSVLLLIASYESGQLVPKLEKIVEPKIGSNLDSDGNISAAACSSLLTCLQDFRRTIFSTGAHLTNIAGTQVFRKAGNAEEILNRLKTEAGIECYVPTGDEEAELSFLAVKHKYGTYDNPVVIDVGGGSSEIAVKNRRISLPMGAVELAKTAGISVKKYKEIINSKLESFTFDEDRKGLKAVAVGGTAVTLAMMESELEKYESEKVEGIEVPKNNIGPWLKKLQKLNYEELANITGLPDSRRDIILPGLTILDAILKTLKLKSVTVSTWGIRHGLILRYLSEHGRL